MGCTRAESECPRSGRPVRGTGKYTSRKIPMKTCKDYDGPPCCSSCHDDAEFFYPEYPLGQICDTDGEVIAELCCTVLDFVQTSVLP